jgi:DNA-binding LytR/AlgR family response regulator
MMSGLRVLIIEDEKHAANRLVQLAKPLLPEAVFSGPLDSITAAVAWISANPAPDLIFCDIQLADGQSFEIFSHTAIQSPIIFTTAFDQHAIQAFKLNSLDYLLKPLDIKDLELAIQKFRKQQTSSTLDLSSLMHLLQPKQNQFKSRFLIKYGEKIQSVQVEEVAFCFSAEKTTYLQNHEGRRYIVDYTLDQLEEMLDPNVFFRLNRKFISSIQAIAEIHTYSNSRLKIKLHNCDDNEILVSREKVAALKEWLDK